MIRVDTVAELFDVGLLLAGQPLPAGRPGRVVGNSPRSSRWPSRRVAGRTG